MSHVIRIPPEIYARLERHAKGFDTPANVIERLLDHYEGVAKSQPSRDTSPMDRSRDNTKYQFNGQEYGKGRLVLAVVQQYVLDNPDTTFAELQSVFPRQLQGSIGVFNEFSEVSRKYGNKNHKRHFIKDTELVKLSDCTIAVSTEWGAGNFPGFLLHLEELGFDVSPVYD